MSIETDELETQTNSIAANLKYIVDDETDLDALESQLDRIIAKMKQVQETEAEAIDDINYGVGALTPKNNN